jgi:hypothetical protein
MSHKFLLNSSFHSLLNAIDQELLNKAQEAGCPFCDGRLDRADYPRSPLGIPAQFRESYDERFSLCCVECRKRTTPPSVRFFGRRWYPAPVLVLISLLTLGINDYRLGQLKRHFGNKPKAYARPTLKSKSLFLVIYFLSLLNRSKRR